MLNGYMILIKKILEAKSVELHDHSVKTSKILGNLINIAHASGFPMAITPDEAVILGLLHDIGKVYINDVIYYKQDSLSEREWETIKLHPAWGKQFVQGTVFENYGEFIIQHHEKSDGSGYPNKLKSGSIHEVSYLLNIADQLASLIENRPYKRAMSDKATLLTVVMQNIEPVFGSETKNIIDRTIDCLIDINEFKIPLTTPVFNGFEKQRVYDLFQL